MENRKMSHTCKRKERTQSEREHLIHLEEEEKASFETLLEIVSQYSWVPDNGID